MGNWSDRVKYQGKTVNLGLRYMIAAANEMLKAAVNGGENEQLTIMQGSWSGASASAGTHTGSGAMDCTPYNWRNRERVFRLLGMAAWHRPAIPGTWPEHMHAIVDGDGGVSPAAARQVKAYHGRKNGLANNGPDTGYRMRVFPLFVFPEKPHGKPGTCWVTKAGKSYEQPTKDAPAKSDYKVGDTFAVVAVVNVSGSYWGINRQAECFPMVSLTRTKPGTTPAPVVVIDPRRWKVTLPEGSPTEHYPLKADAPYCLNNGDHWLFKAPVNGATTGGSKYPRSELREMNTNGSKASWSNRKGRHLLTGRSTVTHLPGKKPEVVIAQVHDADDDVVMILVSGDKVYLSESLGKGKGSKRHLLVSGYRVGQTLGWSIDATPTGIRTTVNGKRVDVKRIVSGAYFKAGCYCQANEDNGTGYGEVVVNQLEVSHA